LGGSGDLKRGQREKMVPLRYESGATPERAPPREPAQTA
jgi:hypothetical protein